MTFSNRVLCAVVVDSEQNTGEDQCIQTAHRINGNQCQGYEIEKRKKKKRQNIERPVYIYIKVAFI